MRIFADTITPSVILAALHDAQAEATQTSASYWTASENGRRRARTLEVTMEGYGPQHTRHKNTGKHGGGTGDMAATWMDWGWLIAVLFRYEPTAVIGQYDGRDQFHDRTARDITHRLRTDTSAKNFAVRYAAVWENPYADTWLDPWVPTSPFVHVDRVCPANELAPIHSVPALDRWLEGAST